MSTTCYLCGKQIGPENQTGDHRLPMLLLDREQPKVRGFDYGGKAPTHAVCNNRFKSETYGRSALSLIRALHDPNCVKETKSHIALNSSCFKDFDKSTLEFFRIVDVRGQDVDAIHNLSQKLERPSVNALSIAINVTLSVLAKSGAALLIDRHLSGNPSRWRIYALPHTGELTHERLEKVFPGRKPFDKDVSVCIEPLSEEDYSLVFLAHGIFVIFIFQFSISTELIAQVRARFPNSDCASFEGSSLMELVNYAWRKV